MLLSIATVGFLLTVATIALLLLTIAAVGFLLAVATVGLLAVA